MADEIEIPLTLSQRIDVLAVQRSGMVRGYMWFFGVLAVWTTIAGVVSVMAQDWSVATLSLVTAALSGLLWWSAQRALHRRPATVQWMDDLRRGRPPSR